MADNWQRLGEIIPNAFSATNKITKRVPWSMVREYKLQGWIVAEINGTYVTLEKTGGQE